jgi:hypothetical protein
MMERRGMFDKVEPTTFTPPVEEPRRRLKQHAEEQIAGAKEKKPRSIITIALFAIIVIAGLYYLTTLVLHHTHVSACEDMARKHLSMNGETIQCSANNVGTLSFGKNMNCTCIWNWQDKNGVLLIDENGNVTQEAQQ